MMRKDAFIASFLVFFFIVSCDNSEENTSKEKDPDPIVENIQPESPQIAEEAFFEEELKVEKETYELDWEAYQDSLRTIALSQKPNEELKSGFLQELYLRGVVNELDDTLKFDIPFDVHGADCGAPDCYTTHVRFSIPYAGELAFPPSLAFSEQETGCSENPYYIENEFELVSDTKDHVIYHCAEKKRTLLIYGPDTENKDVLYFLNYKVKDIDPSEPFKDYEEGDNRFIYVSWMLTTNEYDFFID